jgi:phosphate transport system permease protein
VSATPADKQVLTGTTSTTSNRPGAPKGGARTGRTKSRPADRIFKGLSTGAASLIMAILAGVALFLIIKAIPAIGADWATNPQLNTGVTQGHHSFWGYVAPLIWGTVFVSAIGLLIGAPIAVGIALFISHYAPRRIAGVLSYIVDLLAAVPSIVFGLWGIFVIRPFLLPLTVWLNHHLGWIPLFSGQASATGSTVLAGAVVLAVMVIPIITAISREIFLQTPRLHEEAALAMGATKWEMIRLAVFPYARSGMVSAILLGLGRALGETMAIALIVSPSLIFSLKILTDGQNSQTVAANAALNFPDANDLQRDALIGTGLILFVISFAVNLVARVIVSRTGPGSAGKKPKRRIVQLPPSDPTSILLLDAKTGGLSPNPIEGS